MQIPSQTAQIRMKGKEGGRAVLGSGKRPEERAGSEARRSTSYAARTAVKMPQRMHSFTAMIQLDECCTGIENQLTSNAQLIAAIPTATND